MQSKVVVLSDGVTGSVINISENNSDYGYVRVQQIRTVVDDNGFLRRKSVYALLPGLMNELQESGFYAGQQLDGKIVIEEALEPFNTKDPGRDIKVAGDTGIMCTVMGLPIYRRTKFTFNTSINDVLVKHDNVEELKGAFNNPVKNVVSKMKPSETFDI
jgi:hypothetical protein